MSKKIVLMIISCSVFLSVLPGELHGQDVALDFRISGQMFSPGMIFELDLHIRNSGPAYDDCQLFVALTIGTGEFWFYPSWCQYPDEIDWEDISLSESADEWKTIFPAFEWPDGMGEFSGAMFLGAVAYQGELISNLADVTFGWTETPVDTPTPPPLPTNFVSVPAGTFRMGSPTTEMCRWDDEGPVHEVRISKGFNILSTEITQQEWIHIFGDNPSHFSGLNHPVESVTWYDCCIYCNRLSILAGLTPCYYSDESFSNVFDGTPPVTSGRVYWKQDADGYRLPTEAEWEYACRAGTTSAYNNGSNNTDCYEDPNLDPVAWYSYNSGPGGQSETQPVGLKQPNSLNIYDMHGNVWEWCWDWYDSDYYGSSPENDPAGPSTGSKRVVRGGSWYSFAKLCRSGNRNGFEPGNAYSAAGFRIVKTTD